MEEIFELIKAFNRLKEKIVELIGKIDLLLKSPAPDCRDARWCVSDKDGKHCISEKDAPPCVSTDGYVEEEGACRILHVSPRTLARMRKTGKIPWLKQKRKVLYKRDDLLEYLENSQK